MTIERKILIILGIVVLACAVFGFNEVERYDYSGGGPGMMGKAVNAPAYEYSVTNFSGGFGPAWDGDWNGGKKGGPNNLENQLNMMGSQGWQLISVDGNKYIFMRPVGQWR